MIIEERLYIKIGDLYLKEFDGNSAALSVSNEYAFSEKINNFAYAISIKSQLEALGIESSIYLQTSKTETHMSEKSDSEIRALAGYAE